MWIGIVGRGTVGDAYARVLGISHEVLVHDIKGGVPFEDILTCEAVLLCLPTPRCGDSAMLDVSIIRDVVSKMQDYDGLVLIKSTVPIGFTASLSLPNVAHWPEFLTERRAYEDVLNQKTHIIGVAKPLSGKAAAALLNILGLNYQIMHSDESEAVKLFLNAFYAVKVAMFNELRNCADAYKVRWEVIREAMLMVGMLHPEHTKVPGPDGRRGFGGKCLPKDLACVVELMRTSGCTAAMTLSALVRNMEDRIREP